MPLPGSPEAPGPGSYEIADYKGPDKHYMSSSMFVSTTSRWMGQANNAEIPGPGEQIFSIIAGYMYIFIPLPIIDIMRII